MEAEKELEEGRAGENGKKCRGRKYSLKEIRGYGLV